MISIEAKKQKDGTLRKMSSRSILGKIALFMSNCLVHVKKSLLHSFEYLKYFRLRFRNLDRKDGYSQLNKELIAARLLKTSFIEP